MDAGQIVVRLLADARALDKGLLYSEQRISRFSKQVTRTGDAMTRGLTVPILAAAGASAKLALDFDHQFKLIGGLVGVSGKQLDVYKQKVLDMAPALGKTPQELAEALYFVTSSGFKGAAALRVLEASAKASAAGLGDTAVVADALTSAVNAYGEKTLSAARATDIMLAAVREGKAEPEELASSIGQVIPAASQLGVTFDQVGAALASMTLTGQSASEAAVALNQVLMNSLKPTKEGADALKSVGTSYAEMRKEFAEKGLLPTLNKLKDAFGGNVEEMAKVFGNVRSLRAVLALTGAAGEKTSEIFKELAKDGNDTSKAFEKMAKSDGFKLQQAWAELQKTMIEFGDVVVPMLVDLAEAGTNLVKWFDDLDPATKKTVVTIGLFVAAIGPALSMIGRMGSGVSTLATLMSKLRGATAGAAGAQEALNVAQAVGGKSKGGKAAVDSYSQKMWKLAGGGAGASSVGGGGPLAGAAAGVVIPVALVAVAAGATIALTKSLNDQEGMTNRQPGTRRWGRGGNNDPSFMVNKQREQDVSKITAELILKSGSSDKALNRTMAIIGDIQKAAAKGIDLKIGKDATITEMMELRHELINQLDITGKQADRILHAIFGKEYKLRADPKPMSKAAMQAQAQVQHLQDKLNEVGAMNVTPSVVVKTSGTEQLGYIKSMIDGIQSKTVTLNILKDYGYTGPGKPQALGGSYVLDRATSFIAGEAGREIAAFFPLNSPTRSLQLYDQLTAQLAPYLPTPTTTSAGRGSAGASSATSAGGASPVIYAGPQAVEVPVYLDGELIAHHAIDLADALEHRGRMGEA